MSFSVMLKQLREEHHLSQKDLADYLGITRQAIASYELAKREPDYDVLKKLADYFGVSVDYILGRAGCRDVNAITIGNNIKLIRGKMTYKELSEAVGAKTGALLFPEMIELYEKGERMPFVGTIKILSKYVGVHESFFYAHNTIELLEKEKELYKLEMEQTNLNLHKINTSTDYVNNDLIDWAVKEDNIEYLKLAKEIHDVGLQPEVLKPLIASMEKRNG